MRVLKQYEPKIVMKFFEEISSIPRGSLNEEKIADYLVDFAEKRGLEVKRDKWNNVLIKKPATPGYDMLDTVIMQGHSDMVCVAEEGYVHDFENDGLKLYVEDGCIKARGTSLGADDGIGVAYGLAILDSKEICHPNLEVVFTAAEEVGMIGASHFDMSWLSGKRLFSFDAGGFTEGRIYVGSAGSDKFLLEQDLTYQKATCNQMFEVSIEGLRGGHSGSDIVHGGGNGSVLVGRLLRKLFDANPSVEVYEIRSGNPNNPIKHAIPDRGSVIINWENEDELREIVDSFEKDIQKELMNVDDHVSVSIKPKKKMKEKRFTKETVECLVDVLTLLPNGVQAMNKFFTDTPETSMNVGSLEIVGDKLSYHISSRGAMESSMDAVEEKIKTIAKVKNIRMNKSARLPVWDNKANSKLQNLVERKYIEIYKEAPRFKVAHGSGECGMFRRGLGEDLETIAIGPIIYEEHTANEYMEIHSVNELYKFFCILLNELKDM